MILSQIAYTKGQETKIIMVLVLGRKGDKLACLLDEAISRKETDIIKSNIKKLSQYPLHNKTSWIKTYTPSAYKSGYREFFMKNIKVKKSYSLISDQRISASKNTFI